MVAGKYNAPESTHWEWRAFHEFQVGEWYRICQLRESVFVVEQDCPYLDADGLDPPAWHLCGWQEDDLVAYLRLLPPEYSVHPEIPVPDNRQVVSIGRVVVSPAHRGRQLGRLAMKEGMAGARSRYPDHVLQVSAQAHLQVFYNSLGFEQVTPEYLEDGIPHLGMHFEVDGIAA